MPLKCLIHLFYHLRFSYYLIVTYDRPGGKYGPPLDPVTVEEKSEAIIREDLQKASQLLASSFKVKIDKNCVVDFHHQFLYFIKGFVLFCILKFLLFDDIYSLLISTFIPDIYLYLLTIISDAFLILFYFNSIRLNFITFLIFLFLFLNYILAEFFIFHFYNNLIT